MACYYIVISSTHLRDGQLRSIKGVFRGPIGAGGRKNNQTDEGASSNLYCELCDKQYVRQQQFDNHINSYDHHHKQRLKELKQREFHRAAACRRQREERRDERLLRKRLRHRSRREDKADRRRALGSGPMFRSTTVAVEPASATEKDSSHGAGAPGPDPQSSPGSGLASDTRHPSQRRNANIVTPGDITPENGAAGQSGAFRKLPWATAFFSDSIRANNNNNNDDEPANSKNKAFAANRGRPVCFSLPKRSCVLLHRAAAVFIQAGRSSRDSKTTTRDEKQISSTPCVRARTRELDDKLKGILSLCDRRRGTGAQVHAGGGTAAQDGSGSRLGAKVSGNQDLRVIDGRLTGAQSSTGDQSKEGGMTRAQDGRQSPTAQSSGGSGTWAEDRSRTDGECGPGARTRAPSCGQTATETEVTRGGDGSGTGVRLVGPSATGPRISRGTTSGAHFTGDRDLGGTGAVPFHGLGARVIQEGGGIGTGAQATWQSGAALEIMLRCAARDQDGAGVAVGSATGAEGCRQNETGDQKGGARRTGTGAENGTESLRSGTGSRPTAAGHRAPSGDPPPPLPFKCQSPAFETSDKPDLDELRHFSALLQKAKSEKQAQDSSPKRTPTWPPGRPSEPFCPVLSRDGSRVLLWPSEMLRRTRTSPSLSYSVNPLLYDFRAHARGRGQEVGGIKSAVIKRAGRQCKRERGGGGGEAKSDESRDENRGGQAGNPLQAAGRGTAGKAGAAFTHAHASKSTRAGLRRRRRKRRKRKRGRRKSAEETSGKWERGSGIRSALGKMARLERDDVATDERREKQRLSRLAARRLLEGPQKRRRPEEEEAEEERIVRNDALLCRLPAKRRNRSKRANAGAGPQSSSGWGPALTKLLCGGAISPAPRTPRCPEITAPPAGTDTGPGRKHGDGRECGPENDGRGKPTEIKVREASACEAAMSVASPPRRDAAGRRQIRLKCDAAISPVPLSFGALARARRQTAAEGPIGSCDAQKQESTPGIPSATLACQDLWREVTGRRKRKCTERPQSVAGKKGKAGPRRSGLERTLDSTETSEGSSEETRPSHFSPDGTDSAHRDNALDAAVVDTPSEDAARDDHGVQRQHGSEETRPSHFSPDGTDSARQGNALDAAVVDTLSEDAARGDHGSEGTRPSHFSPDGTDSAHRDNALDAAVVDTPSEDAARHDHGVQRQHGSEGTSPSHFWPDGTVKTCQDSNHSAVHSVDSIVVDAPAEDIIKRGHGSEATGLSHSSPDGNAERPDAHEIRSPSCLDVVTERFGPARTAPHGCRRCHPRIQRVDSPHAERIDAPPADAPVSDPELPPSDGVPHREKDKMSAACSANEEHASGKRQRGRSAEPASLGKRPRFSLGLPPGCLPLGAPLLLPPPSSFSFRRSIIQHHLSVVAPPLPLPSYQHLLPAFAPHPMALNPAPPSFLASPAIHVLDAPYPLATEFHPMLSQHHAALLAPPHPPALSLQVLF